MLFCGVEVGQENLLEINFHAQLNYQAIVRPEASHLCGPHHLTPELPIKIGMLTAELLDHNLQIRSTAPSSRSQ